LGRREAMPALVSHSDTEEGKEEITISHDAVSTVRILGVSIMTGGVKLGLSEGT